MAICAGLGWSAEAAAQSSVERAQQTIENARHAQIDAYVTEIRDRVGQAYVDLSIDPCSEGAMERFRAEVASAQADLDAYKQYVSGVHDQLTAKINQAIAKLLVAGGEDRLGKYEEPLIKVKALAINAAKLGLFGTKVAVEKATTAAQKVAIDAGKAALKEASQTALTKTGASFAGTVGTKVLPLVVVVSNFYDAYQNIQAEVDAYGDMAIIDEMNDFINELAPKAHEIQRVVIAIENAESIIAEFVADAQKLVDDCDEPDETASDQAGSDVAKTMVVDETTDEPLGNVTLFIPDGETPETPKSIDGGEEYQNPDQSGTVVVDAVCHQKVSYRVGPGENPPSKIELKHKVIRAYVPCDFKPSEVSDYAAELGVDLADGSSAYSIDPVNFSKSSCVLVIREYTPNNSAANNNAEPSPGGGATGGVCSQTPDYKTPDGLSDQVSEDSQKDETSSAALDEGGGGSPDGGSSGTPGGGSSGTPGGGQSGTPDGSSSSTPDGGESKIPDESGRTPEPDVDRSGQAKPAYADERLINAPLATSVGSWGQDYADQWALRNIGWMDKKGRSILPVKAYPVVVAVIDTGFDGRHRDLAGSAWINRDEVPGNDKDDDDNGYVDDVYGWNFIDENGDVRDLNGHGTVVAGIIAAHPRNGIGIAGINPWARIMPLKITNFRNKGGSINLAKAVAYAADNGARVINLSVGGKTLTRIENAAINYAKRKGVVVVVASGNLGINLKDFSPAGFPGVVTVAATDVKRRRAKFSNWGAAVDLAAPGVDILSTRARQTDLLIMERKNYEPKLAIVAKDYYRVTGSSFSAPFVSGVASLLLSVNPDLKAVQVMRILAHSARDIDIPGWDQFTGFGLLDASRALEADPNFYVSARISGLSGVRIEGRTHIRVKGTAAADQLARAWVEIGKGANSASWRRVSAYLDKSVRGGVIADIPAGDFSGSKRWTVRIISEHRNGRKREARFDLKLG